MVKCSCDLLDPGALKSALHQEEINELKLMKKLKKLMNFSISCMLSLVILGIPRLILVYFFVNCCYELLFVLLREASFISWLKLSNLDLLLQTRLMSQFLMNLQSLV